MKKYHVFYAGFSGSAHLGSLGETLAHIVARTACQNVGDAVTLSEDISDCDYYSDMMREEITYYRNSAGIQTYTEDLFYEGLDYIAAECEPLEMPLRTSSYAKRFSGFKYDMSVSFLRKQEYISYIKRSINRSTRRLSKALIAEQL